MRLTKELHRSARGPVANEEDWWRLVYEDGRLFVEHEQDHMDVRNETEGRRSTTEMDLEVFLQEPGQGEAHRKLREFLASNFRGEIDGATGR